MIEKRILLVLLFLCVMVLSAAQLSNAVAQSSVEQSTSDPYSIDLSEWVHENSKLGTTSYRQDELFMRAKHSGYYYVLVAPEENSSRAATVSITLRNVNGAASKYGYGLIFHSDPTPLKQDYAFVIDTVKKRYRVIRHTSNDEIRVIPWTDNLFINSGAQENTLEARDLGSKTELFINGHLITTVDNTYAFATGSPGLYTDNVNIAFRDLTIDHRGSLPHFR